MWRLTLRFPINIPSRVGSAVSTNEVCWSSANILRGLVANQPPPEGAAAFRAHAAQVYPAQTQEQNRNGRRNQEIPKNKPVAALEGSVGMGLCLASAGNEKEGRREPARAA